MSGDGKENKYHQHHHPFEYKLVSFNLGRSLRHKG